MDLGTTSVQCGPTLTNHVCTDPISLHSEFWADINMGWDTVQPSIGAGPLTIQQMESLLKRNSVCMLCLH